MIILIYPNSEVEKYTMIKQIFIGLCLLLSLSSFASEFDETYVTHEQFVAMSDEDQQKIIIKFMEFMVSSEAQSKMDEVVKNGTPAEKEKWKRMFQIFSNALIDSAQAADDPYAFYNEGYKAARAAIPEGNVCIYAGWVSKVKPGGNICAHPSGVTDKDHKGKIGNLVKYKDATAACKAPTQITCNPVVFGFGKDKNPFCASATPVAHNSSLECMQKSIGKGVSKADKDARLASIAENFKKDPKLFQEVMEFIFYSCACQPDQANGSNIINTEYHKYIKPHRTCMALLNQTKQILTQNACKNPEIDESVSVMTKFLGDVSQKAASHKVIQSVINGTYRPNGKEKIIRDIDRTWGKFIDDAYKGDDKAAALCKKISDRTIKDPPKVSCEVNCTTVAQAAGAAKDAENSYSCIPKIITEETGKDKKEDSLPAFVIKTQKEAEDKLKADDKTKNLSCTVGLPEDPVKPTDDKDKKDAYKLTVTSTDADKTVTLVAKVDGKDKAGKEGPPATVTYKWYKESDTTKASLGTADTYIAPKEVAPAKVCVDATFKADGADKTETKCEEVAASAAAATNPSVGPTQPGFQGPQPRQQHIHINYGIR